MDIHTFLQSLPFYSSIENWGEICYSVFGFIFKQHLPKELWSHESEKEGQETQ